MPILDVSVVLRASRSPSWGAKVHGTTRDTGKETSYQRSSSFHLSCHNMRMLYLVRFCNIYSCDVCGGSLYVLVLPRPPLSIMRSK
jgi:hypothetical protein